MVRKIRLRGHVIRLFAMQPCSSQSEPPSCPTCGTTYDDGKNRKCFYLCCEFEDCFDCVLNQNIYQCHKFKPGPRRYLVSEEDDNNDDGEKLKVTLKTEVAETKILPVATSGDENDNVINSDIEIKVEYESVKLNLKCMAEKFLPEKHRNAVVILKRLAEPAEVDESQIDCKDDQPMVLVAKRRSSRLIRGNNSKA